MWIRSKAGSFPLDPRRANNRAMSHTVAEGWFAARVWEPVLLHDVLAGRGGK